MSPLKKKVDANLLFSATRNRNGPNGNKTIILASDSDDDSNAEDEIPDLSPTKLSFERSGYSMEKSFLGRHEVTLFSEDAESDEEERRIGLETALVEEYESNDSEIESPARPKKKSVRKRIIVMSSSDEENDLGEDKENVDSNEASFDLGAIKRQYETPKPKKNYREQQIEESEDDYDLQDSFINDKSLSGDETWSESDDESSEKSESDDENAEKSDSEESEHETKEVKKPKSVVKKQKEYMQKVETKTFLDSLGDEKITPRTHPDAVKYLNKYDRNKAELADFLFKLFNEQVFDNCLPHQMPLVWSKTLNKTAGRCICKRIRQAGRVDRECSIELASKVLTSADRLRDTLIHEMCHAAVWLINEINGGHGQLFKSYGQMATRKYPELPLITRCHNYVIETKFAYICQSCSYQYKRHSKSIDTTKKQCGKRQCQVTGAQLKLHVWDKSMKEYVDPEKRQKSAKKPNRFAAFVQDNYKNCRTPGKTHKEAMTELGQMFSQM